MLLFLYTGLPLEGPAGVARGRRLFQYVLTPYPPVELAAHNRPSNGLHSNPAPMEDQPPRQASDSLGCAVEKVFRLSAPKEPNLVEHLRLLAYTWSVEECLELCCRLKTPECQYVWLIGYRCLAVSCVVPSHCRPQHVADEETSIQSVYIKLAPTTNKYMFSNAFVSRLDGGEDKLHDFSDKSHDKSHDYVNSDSPNDSPPIACVHSPVIVYLPNDQVCLNGTGSTDDKVASSSCFNITS